MAQFLEGPTPPLLPFNEGVGDSDYAFQKNLLLICFNDSHSKVMKKVLKSLVILKAFFILKIFIFLSRLFGHVEKMACLEDKVNSEISKMYLQPVNKRIQHTY